MEDILNPNLTKNQLLRILRKWIRDHPKIWEAYLKEKAKTYK